MTKFLDSRGPFAPDPFDVSVALGLVQGWRILTKFGRNSDIDAGTEDIWMQGGIRVLPTTAATATIVSSSVNDDSAGTGAQTILIQGLDANYVEAEETITMDGTTGVTSAGSYIRLHRAYVTSAGSVGTNDGNITATIDGNVQISIAAGAGQTEVAMYTVPTGHLFLIKKLELIAGQQGVSDLTMVLQTNENGAAWRSQHSANVYEGQGVFTTALVCAGKTDIRVQGVSTGNNLNASASLYGYIIDEDYADRGNLLHYVASGL